MVRTIYLALLLACLLPAQNIRWTQIKSTDRHGNGTYGQAFSGSSVSGHGTVFDSMGNLTDSGYPFGTVFQIAQYTVGSLPVSPNLGSVAYVTDGNSLTDCTVGGGGNKVLCIYSGSWTPMVSWDQIYGTRQGTSVVPQMAGINSGATGAVLCNDAQGNATTSGCASGYYQTLQNNGSSATQRGKTNLIAGTNIVLTMVDNPGNNSTDVTINASGGATAPGANAQMVYNKAGAFGASSLLIFNDSSSVVTLSRVNSGSAYVGPNFVANITGPSPSDPTFQNSDRSWYATASGDILGQSISLAHGVTVGVADTGGIYGFSGNGVLTVSSCIGCGGGGGGGGSPAGPTAAVQFNNAGVFGGSSSLTWVDASKTLTAANGTIVANIFNSSATGANHAFQTQTSSAYITGAGDILGQSLSLAHGVVVGVADTGGMYGLSGAGILTVAACSGCGGSGSPGGPTASVQYNNSGTFGGNTNFIYDPVNNVITMNRVSATSGIITPLVNLNVTGATSGTHVLQTSGSSFYVDKDGNIAGQTLALAHGVTVGVADTGGVYGWAGTGVITVASCVGCGGSGGSPAGPSASVQFNNGGVFGGSSFLTWVDATKTLTDSGGTIVSTLFNSAATGSNHAFQTQSSSAYISGAGDISGQTLSLAHGVVVGVADTGGVYGFSGLGVLTVASCTGCGSGGSPGGSNTNIQYNNSGAFGGSSNFFYNSGNNAVTLNYVNSNSGVNSPLFNSLNPALLPAGAHTFQNNDSSFYVNKSGNIAGQTLALAYGITTGVVGGPSSLGGGGDIVGSWTVGSGGAGSIAACAASGYGSGAACTSASGGAIYLRPLPSGSGLSCSGVSDGWIAVQTNSGAHNLVVCIGGVITKAALTP